jgi:signal transduction histidine kinase
LRSNHVWCITEDRDGMIWFGLRTNGLDRLDPATDAVTHFPPGRGDSTLSDDPALALLAASDGSIWAATAGGGLQRLDPRRRRVTRYDESRGFPENMVYGVLEDGHHDLWLSTGKGIVRFSPPTGQARLFGLADGIQSTEFTAGTCCKTSDGWMGFGGINGFNWFHPDSIAFNTAPPPVALTSFRVFDAERPVAPVPHPATPLVLRRDENFFSVEFAALDYTSPGENQYAYVLEGFDRDWVHAGRSHRATYTNVGPGEYLFRIQAANNDGVWNTAGVSLTVVILPAFWETWWFRLLVVIAIGSLTVLLYRYRINRLLAVHRTRERIARDLHDDVSAILSGIVYFSSAVEMDRGNALSDRSSHFLTQIRRSSAEVLELLHDIIWSIHPDGDSLESILTKCRRFAADLCESRGITHDIMVSDSGPERRVDPEKRRDLWLMYKEMVTNAVRHSACTALQVRLNAGPEGEIALIVADNGTGFDTAQPGRESGLRNIRARATALRGDLHLVSTPGTGTRWEFRSVL